jgi:hypothetical protein
VALIWNYLDNTWTMRDLPNATAGIHAICADGGGTTYAQLKTAATKFSDWTTAGTKYSDLSPSAGATRKTILASTDNLIYVIGNGNSANGALFSCEAERAYISMGDAQRVKYFRSVWPRFETDMSQEVEISVGVSMGVNELPSWQTVTYTVGTSRKVDVNKSGRFLGIRVRSSSGTPWKLRSMDVDYELQGLW